MLLTSLIKLNDANFICSFNFEKALKVLKKLKTIIKNL